MDPRDALRGSFGFDDFRPGQAEAVQAGLAGRDSLIVMPTGSGKSLCYQLPALMRHGLTLVVSPLVALMQDQVQALRRFAPGKVELVNAQRGASLNAETLERAAQGELRLLYVAPERFSAPAFASAMRRTRVGLFVVDEAHCVSQWGHDFRPDYFALADAAADVGARATMALTATATPKVALDIERRLRLRDPLRVTTGFDRPNLSFAVVPVGGDADKERRLAAALREPDALPAIVYAGTRSASERLAHALGRSLGEDVLTYHAGLDRDRRASVQSRFMSGEARVIVATNAFGMGIDKADVRTVAHATVPQSLEAYYQEAGRAGRDGRPARALLFAAQRDKGLHVFFIQRAQVDDGAFGRVAERLRWASLGGDRYDVGLSELGGLAGPKADADTLRAVIGHLARAGVVRPLPSAPDRVVGVLHGGWEGRGLAVCRTSARDAERVRWSQYRTIWGYVETEQCRRTALLAHFGDRSAPQPVVGCCDVCDPAVLPGAPVGPPAAGRGGPARTARRGSRSALTRADACALPESLDGAIVQVVAGARPPVGRTRAVEILRGGRSKVIAEHAYDGLPEYGIYAHLRAADVLGRVDELLNVGRLRSTGGRFPKLRAA